MTFKEINVIYSEIKIETSEPTENKILSELNELVPLPTVPRKKPDIKKASDVKNNSKEPKSINQIDMKKVKKIECKGVEVKIDEQPKHSRK